MLLPIVAYSQCRVQKNVRPDGATIRYLSPEMVAGNDKLEYGMSLQTNGVAYYLASVIRFSEKALKPSELFIQYSSSQSSILKPYHAELSYMKGSEVYLVLYTLTKEDIKRLLLGDLKSFNFKTSDGYRNILTVSKNKDVLKRHYKCLTN
jgi:hypothetical protein